ncbi:hypothetical protein EGW08_022179 [Elysia chlorotica]|uniref:Uncharacterized protein n=1 Tax=Elysia chlorotica TaxID=188477 RepID=A0A433SLR2_ELYCH|nr:hypothetical protein EGW08_022179 [Elysia chlorotica]
MSISMTKESRSRSRTFSELIPAPSNIRAVFEKRHGKWDPDARLKIYGNKQWHQANNEARFVVDREPPMDPTGVPTNFKPIEGIEKAYDFVAQSYVEYVMLLQLMTASLRHLLHPQKRLLFKRFIEAVACRVCELKVSGESSVQSV